MQARYFPFIENLIRFGYASTIFLHHPAHLKCFDNKYTMKVCRERAVKMDRLIDAINKFYIEFITFGSI